ncbi:MAG: acetyl-CoA hydrolase/transferase C-terminal domain-containing protein [Clostridia bacterium]|nr:acetyl-CoA hydrolase/transferase C-terminal domain-containing protein [Clostridia bacterium]
MAKKMTLSQALALVKSGDVIVTGLGCAEGREFLTHLHEIADRVKNVTVTNCLPMGDYQFFTNPAYKDSFQLDGWFYSPALRKAHANGNISFIPNHLHLAAIKRLDNKRTTIYLGNCTPPDKHGYVSLSLSNTYEKRMMADCDYIILEVNPKLPRTFGDVQMHESEVDIFIDVDYDIPEIPDVPPTDKDLIIGKLIADYINDGDCLQLGIGGIPNAVTKSLYGKKNLGIHTEMLTTGMAQLAKAGVINGRCKQQQKGKMVAAFAMGTKELYDYMDDNPACCIMDGGYVNDPMVIAKNDNQISINTTIEVDITGQCCSESIGSMQFSGSGGQSDTACGAQKSKNGKSFIALYSTAMVRNKVTGEKEEVSKIVAQLKQGAAVTLSRNDLHYLVTEYGVVNLRGTSIKERVERIISIAHPQFREQLTKEAYDLGIIR